MKKKTVLTENQQQVLDIYIKIVKEKKRRPSMVDMAVAGCTRDKIARSFGSTEKLREIAKREFPEIYNSVVDESLFTRKVFEELRQEAKTYKRFVITTAIVGASVDENFLASIDTYCREKDALLLILPCADPAASVGWDLDPILKDRQIVFRDLALNKKMFVSSIKLSAKHIDPITSLGRIGQRNGSFIYASPKQRLKMIPTSARKLPVALMTTGAITLPAYKTSRYMSERTAYIADNDHIMGAIVVELESDTKFHFRQVQADKSGAFIDLGVCYDGDDTYKVKARALVMGDYHSGETDPNADRCWKDVLKTIGADTAVFHDLFNGKSISHHDIFKKLTLARFAKENKLNLETELRGVTRDLNGYIPLVNKCVIVKSNHDEWLDRYLEGFHFRHDPHNIELALELCQVQIKKKDPLQYAVEKFGLSDKSKVYWLKRNQDFKISKIELGAHGDKGSGGAPGSLPAMEFAYGMSVTGHTHTAEILRECYQVGTSSYLQLEYNETGLSAWTHTSCLVYNTGQRQLINVVDGKWRLED